MATVRTMGAAPKNFMSRGEQVKALYSKGVKVWPTEPIIADFFITINSGTDRVFILPTSGRLNNVNNSYSWIVDWGDGTSTSHGGTGTTTSGITHTYPAANTSYNIKIKPQNPSELGWLRAFGFTTSTTGSNTTANKAKVLAVGGQLTEQMVRTASTNNYVCAYMFYRCENLTMSSTFQLPQNITSVGNLFCSGMFQYCASLTMNAIFQLPQSLTSVGAQFCYDMFLGCSNLTMNSIFQLPRGLINTSTDFCSSMFGECSSLTMNSIFQLPPNITTAGAQFCYAMFNGCVNLTFNSVFQLPQNITSVGIYFCNSMFQVCTSITTGVTHFFGAFTTTQAQLNQSGVYGTTFYGCSALTETLTDIPQLKMTPNTARQTFRGAPADLIAPLHANWK